MNLPAPQPSPILQVTDLVIETTDRVAPRQLVAGVSLTVARGETLALVGESGAGKSLTARAILGLLPPGCGICQGQICFDGIQLANASTAQLTAVRGKRIGMAFQEQGTALNPLMTIGAQLTEPMTLHRGLSYYHAREQAVGRLEALGLKEAPALLNLYPHQLSGGMRQRVIVAMALAGDPELLIADEPTSAIDTTTLTHLLAALSVAQAEHHLAILLITHDVVMASTYAHRLAIMRHGRLVETLDRAQFCGQAQHPYSRELWALATLAPSPSPGARE